MAERITGHTELIGLMAYPIRHSSSPAMHNEAFAYLGLDYAYLAFEVDNSTLEDAIKGLRALKMVGSNVSMPNKTVVGQYLDKLSPAAELCGAVLSTVVIVLSRIRCAVWLEPVSEPETLVSMAARAPWKVALSTPASDTNCFAFSYN